MSEDRGQETGVRGQVPAAPVPVCSSPDRTAAEMGYRMPGEFEPVDAVWVTPPHNTETWPGCFDEAVAQHAKFVDAMRKVVRVETIGPGRVHDWPSNDSWARDYGPLFVVGPERGDLACHDFVFNGWGGKYNAEYADDDVVPRRVAELLDLPIWVHDLVLEGGSVDFNGCGTVLTTEQCLLNENRNKHLTREQIARVLADCFASPHVVWLPGGIIGDDTDGHIDDIARFVSPTLIVANRAPDTHADHEMLAANLRVLREARDQNGHKFDIAELPVPDPILYNFPPDRFGPGGPGPVPASYANFLIVNDHVFVPVFGQPNDEDACEVIESATEKTIVPIRAEHLVVGLGALHCLSMQQPKALGTSP